MKLQVTEGCTAYSYEVDGVEWNELTHEQCKEVLLKLINTCDNCQGLQHVFTALVQDIGKYEDLGCCGQYGTIEELIDKVKEILIKENII